MDVRAVKITKAADSGTKTVDSHIIVEEPLLILANGAGIATIMRTPGSDKELAIGFMYSEGLIKDVGDIQMVAVKGDNAADSQNTVSLTLAGGIKPANKRSYEIRSSCGICGQKRVDDLFEDVEAVKGSLKIKSSDIYKIPVIMSERQRLSKLTRGAHAAAFFTQGAFTQGAFTQGASIVACYEDIGRHNALDKLIGHCLLTGIKMDDKLLLLSGRASYEMLAKAVRCGICCVVSISAPSSLAVDIAKRGNIALAGIIRGSSMNIYNKRDTFLD